MQITDDLKQEHQLILSFVALLEGYASIDGGAQLLAKAPLFAEFIREFADSYHHAKEEDVLFKFMAAPGVLPHCNPLPVMLFEHTQARELLQSIDAAAAKGDLPNLVASANAYARLLREHIYKEDNILYPMAENGITETDKAAMQQQYADIEQRLDGAQRWDRFRQLLAELGDNLQD